MSARITVIALLIAIFSALCPCSVTSQCTNQFCFEDDEDDQVSADHANLNTLPRFRANQEEALLKAQEELFNHRRTLDNQKQLLFDLVRTVANEELDVMTQQRALTSVQETVHEIQRNVSVLLQEQTNQGHDSTIHGDTLAVLTHTLASYKQYVEDQDDKLAKQNEMLQTLQDEISTLKRHPLPVYDCLDIWRDGHTASGVYSIYLSRARKYISVYCDMETEGGGWLVFQRRQDGSVDFFRDWDSYKKGFGNVSGEFWLGNDYLHEITSNKKYEVRVDMYDFRNNANYAVYSNFVVAAEGDNYRLTLGSYRGTAGDSLKPCWNNAFSTKDRDNDSVDVVHLSRMFRGGWWYDRCHSANLNGLYLEGERRAYRHRIDWKQADGRRHSLKKVDMKLRPVR